MQPLHTPSSNLIFSTQLLWLWNKRCRNRLFHAAGSKCLSSAASPLPTPPTPPNAHTHTQTHFWTSLPVSCSELEKPSCGAAALDHFKAKGSNSPLGVSCGVWGWQLEWREQWQSKHNMYTFLGEFGFCSNIKILFNLHASKLDKHNGHFTAQNTTIWQRDGYTTTR